MDPCITANPDITGIGVRTAIYAQNILCFVPIVLHLQDGFVSAQEMKGIKDQSIGMLAVAFAILISTIIQAKTAVQGQPITGFHAAVILDLSWMNNTSTWLWFLLYAHHISSSEIEEVADDMEDSGIETEELADDGEYAARTWGLHCPRCRLELGRVSVPATWAAWLCVIRSRACHRHLERRQGVFAHGLRIFDGSRDLFWQSPVLFISSLHLSLMAAVGLWLWSNPTKFGAPIDGCVLTLTIIGRSVQFSSTPLQGLSLAMYSLLAIPLVNLLPPIVFFLALHIAYNQTRFGGFFRQCFMRKSRSLWFHALTECTLTSHQKFTMLH
ncbi:hypothetical protein C8R46DRAFT_243685 [Mycena filopes]|nr:hypothetical protein C8R46DRAFT_243685 [Mycena filopes]